MEEDAGVNVMHILYGIEWSYIIMNLQAVSEWT